MATASVLSHLELLSFAPPGWGGVLLAGFVRSIKVAIGGYSCGVLLGIGGAVGKLYGGAILRDLLEIYTTLIRAIPELVLILLLYYAGTDALSQLLGFAGYGPVDIDGLLAGVLVIAIVQGAYATEVLRGAIQSVPIGQIEAARAYGMPALTALRRVVLPAMLPFALPGLANLWLIATKDTALLAVVGFSELTLATRQAAGATKAYLMFFSAAGVLYLALTIGSNMLIRSLERWSRRGMPSAI